MSDFKPVTLVNDAGDKIEVKTQADYTQYVMGYGYKPEKATKKAEAK